MMMVLSRVDPYSWHGGASVRCDDKKRNLFVWFACYLLRGILTYSLIDSNWVVAPF
jgi:hypothetical protein